MNISKPKKNADYLKRYLIDTIAVKNASIPIQNSNAAFLLISGAIDEIWPSMEMSQSAIELMKTYNHNFQYRQIVFSDLSHWIDLKSVGYMDTKCWPVVLDFINDNLR